MKRLNNEINSNALRSICCFSLLQDIMFIHVNRDGVCPLFGTHNTLSYPDKFPDREIWELLVVCENNENGCTWTGRLRHSEAKI